MPRVAFDLEARKPYFMATFSDAEYERRITALCRGMAQAGLDVLCVYGSAESPGPVAYLTNFSPVVGSAIVVVHADGRMAVATDAVMHGEPMHSMIWMCRVPDVRVVLRRPVYGGPTDELARLTADAVGPAPRVGLAGASALPHWLYAALAARLPELQPADEVLAAVRRFKSDEEVAKMREAGRISDEAMDAVFAGLQEGAEETALAAAAVQRMHLLGGREAFPTSVVAGTHAGLKHGDPRRRPLGSGEMVFIDLGASYDGYKSDLSRCTIVGKASGPGLDLLNVGLALHNAGLEVLAPGRTIDEVARALFNIVRGTRYEPYFCREQFGHCLGISLFEAPGLFAGNTTELRPGMTLAYEPMVVMEALGTGVVEDTLLVTDAGVDRLTRYPTVTWQ